MLLEDKTKISS